jgi:periplasmic divalent cation tolerance protein
MPDSVTHLSVTTSWPDERSARHAAAAVVAERLAACAQVHGPGQSTYRWQGAVEEATEWFCTMKTTQARFPALEQRIRQLHTYEVPEIVATRVVAGNPAYLAWIEEGVR